MNFIGSESRTRHKFIDASQENFADTLSTPEMVEAIGPVGVSIYHGLINNLVVPNIRHGKIQEVPDITRQYGAIALALWPGETVVSPPSHQTFTGVQEETFRRELANKGIPTVEIDEDLQKIYTSFFEEEVWQMSSKVYGEVQHRILDGSYSNFSVLAQGRPTMLLPIAKTVRQTTPATIAHELTHVRQALWRPVVFLDGLIDNVDDLRLADELEAYKNEADFIEGLAASGYTAQPRETTHYTLSSDGKPASRAAAIANIIFSPENMGFGFEPHSTTKKLLADAGFDFLLEPRFRHPSVKSESIPTEH